MIKNIIKMIEDLSDLVSRAEIIMEDMDANLPDNEECNRIHRVYENWLKKLDQISTKN